MGRYRKIVWNEGMLLTPHHFQQSDNYHEELLNSRLGSLAAYGWGVLDLRVNRESITNGSFELLSCTAAMPDGLFLSVPGSDPAPLSRPIEGHFHADIEVLDVHLAVPAARVGAPNIQANGSDSNQMIRYLQQGGVVVDETTGENEQQMAFARTNLRLLFGDEVLEGYTSIKIAELERTATGQAALVEHYIPPALNIGASVWLLNMLRQ